MGYHRTPPHAAPRRNSLDVPYVGITNVGFYFSLKQELEKPVSFGRVFEDNHDELMKKVCNFSFIFNCSSHLYYIINARRACARGLQ